ncbi:MAG: glycosyltransferase family 2 protein [Candidatus Eiseniibacteriota bacterium]|nr:MAG: glycosyltransferase family 2 protein [Candidatus Eisenbacteria bacterium]
MSKVAVIVVNWNAREDTRECIESLGRSSHSPLDVILVDNASSDGSVTHLKQLFPEVTFIQNPRNEMFARASNAGMRLALERGADHLFLLNNDAVVEEGTVHELVRVLESSPDVGLVGSKILYFSQKDVIWSAGGEVMLWAGITRHRGIRQRDSGQFDEQADVGYLTGCALMAKRGLVERVGFLDPSYYMYGEDADWCLRARKTGFRVVYVPASRVWHKVSLSTGGEFSAPKMYEKTRSNVRLFARHARPYHWVTIPLVSVAYLLALLVRGVGKRSLSVPWAILRALADSLKGERSRTDGAAS